MANHNVETVKKLLENIKTLELLPKIASIAAIFILLCSMSLSNNLEDTIASIVTLFVLCLVVVFLLILVQVMWLGPMRRELLQRVKFYSVSPKIKLITVMFIVFELIVFISSYPNVEYHFMLGAGCFYAMWVFWMVISYNMLYGPKRAEALEELKALSNKIHVRHALNELPDSSPLKKELRKVFPEWG